MTRLLLLAEIKRKSVEITLISRDQSDNKIIDKQKVSVEHARSLTKEQLKDLLQKFLLSQKDHKRVEKRVIVGCYLFEPQLTESLQLQLNPLKFNGAITDTQNDLIFIDKHELVCLNDYTVPSQLFEFNKRELKSGHRGLIVSIGNHLQVFEEHVKGVNGKKEVIRIDLGALSFSPHTEEDHEFSLFIRKDTKRTVKFREFINKGGFILVYLYFMQKAHGQIPKEPTLKELVALIQQRNPIALKSVEYFIYILAHFLYSGLILLMLDKELIMTGNFLNKVIKAYADDEKIRAIFLDNLVLANHVKQTFDHLRMSLQTDINGLVLKATLENF